MYILTEEIELIPVLQKENKSKMLLLLWKTKYKQMQYSDILGNTHILCLAQLDEKIDTTPMFSTINVKLSLV